ERRGGSAPAPGHASRRRPPLGWPRTPQRDPGGPMATVSEISSRYVDEVAALDPVRGERWGVATDSTRLTDYSPAGYDALMDLLRRTRQDMEAAPPDPEPERLGKGFLTDWIGGELGILEFGERERMLSIIVGA